MKSYQLKVLSNCITYIILNDNKLQFIVYNFEFIEIY